MNIFARFALWWGTLSMMLATLGTCPCCGGPPCARGVAMLGLLGALVPTFARFKRPQPAEENANAELETLP